MLHSSSTPRAITLPKYSLLSGPSHHGGVSSACCFSLCPPPLLQLWLARPVQPLRHVQERCGGRRCWRRRTGSWRLRGVRRRPRCRRLRRRGACRRRLRWRCPRPCCCPRARCSPGTSRWVLPACSLAHAGAGTQACFGVLLCMLPALLPSLPKAWLHLLISPASQVHRDAHCCSTLPVQTSPAAKGDAALPPDASLAHSGPYPSLASRPLAPALPHPRSFPQTRLCCRLCVPLCVFLRRQVCTR